jgi:hypothetical protein
MTNLTPGSWVRTDWVRTADAAAILGMKQHVFRTIYYTNGDVFGIVPRKPGTRLQWPRIKLVQTAIRRQADCAVMLRALKMLADLAAQQAFVDDPRVEFAREVIKEMKGKY